MLNLSTVKVRAETKHSGSPAHRAFQITFYNQYLHMYANQTKASYKFYEGEINSTQQGSAAP